MNNLNNIYSLESCNACSANPLNNDGNCNFSNPNINFNKDFDTYIAPYMYPPNNLMQNMPFSTDINQNIILPSKYNSPVNSIYTQESGSEEINTSPSLIQNIPTFISCCLCCILLLYIITRVFKINW